MIKRNIILFMIGASLVACSSHLNVLSSSGKIGLLENNSEKSSITTYIQPFKDSMNRAMGEVLAHASVNIEYTRPNGLLGNWTTDALLANQTRNIRMSEPIFCLLNAGGLRSSIGQGNVTRGDLFRLMPFDNEIVWLRLPISRLTDIQNYLIQSGGEPIANASLINGQFFINGTTSETAYFWVITSDYLANGGDHMDFFLKADQRIDKHVLLRDVFIQECLLQKELIVSNEKRIQ
ncbi:MAG: 5'-nucleotidase C-terminal domain-containing protein [Flavobacteriales bacterium]